MVVKIGIIKSGNIGTSPVLDLLLDERADRPNIDVRIIGSGAKMNPEQVAEVTPRVREFNPDFVIFISPNPGAPGPAQARELLSAEGVPAVIIGDAPGAGKKDEMVEQGLGYIIVKGDPMIGARREFLDPTEMASFNADVIKVLALTGAYRVVQRAINELIFQAEAGKPLEVPRIIVTAERAAEAGGFTNPYAKAKAIAAYEAASQVAAINTKACFMVQDPEQYIPLVAGSHELIGAAARLATEAREIEKSNDTVLRTPHSGEGTAISKSRLLDKPK